MPEKRTYGLPFAGEKIEISQGRNGPYSHKDWGNMDLSQAVDFKVPYGTRVVAAAHGVVTSTYDASREAYHGEDPNEGFKPGITNFVAIAHDNGEETFYAHLEAQSVRVEIDQEVSKGDVLAITGESGWVGGEPHLHFQVQRWDEGKHNYVTLPCEFEGYSGPLEDAEIRAQFKNPEQKA